jgi:hypothetical protein
VTVINVYNGLLPWPEDRKVTALRIVQLFPKATPSMDSPPISRWSESLARGVLGTVPVEEDGSAFFLCPPGKTLYFQALDADGLAVQSMQSDFYVHPGERLTCQGCHEPRHRTPPAVARIPLALRRPPSVIRPDIEDACPISFPRLVQPVLKRACAECHAKNPKAPSLAGIEQPGPDPEKARPHRGWTPAYAALSERGFGRSGKPPSRGEVRTVPGQFGAAASRLYQMLKAGHHELKLPPEDWHRLALWLDTNCNFYGAYFDTEAQAAGERILPDLE